MVKIRADAILKEVFLVYPIDATIHEYIFIIFTECLHLSTSYGIRYLEEESLTHKNKARHTEEGMAHIYRNYTYWNLEEWSRVPCGCWVLELEDYCLQFFEQRFMYAPSKCVNFLI